MSRSLPNETSPPCRIGIIDTGVNPWHSHVRGSVRGVRMFAGAAGKIEEDEDFSDLVGHGTAVAGLLRAGLPEAEFYVVRVFDRELKSYPSLVARALLRAAAEGCGIVNLSLGAFPGPGAEVLERACRTVLEAGVMLVAAGRTGNPGLLPAALPGVVGVTCSDTLAPGEVAYMPNDPYPYRASGRPRDLEGLPPESNLWGNSFACARVTLALAQRRLPVGHGIGTFERPALRQLER